MEDCNVNTMGCKKSNSPIFKNSYRRHAADVYEV